MIGNVESLVIETRIFVINKPDSFCISEYFDRKVFMFKINSKFSKLLFHYFYKLQACINFSCYIPNLNNKKCCAEPIK